jgi:ParB-like chromosome segregation protein Spo0J
MGVLNPLLVRFLPDSGKYGIISGQRRYQAASAAGLIELPCIEKDVDDAEAIEIALTENLHHKELTSSEQAIWIHELARLGMSHEEIASRVEKLPLSITSSSVGPYPETAAAEQSQGIVVPVSATEGLLEEAESSILASFRSIAGEVEDELKGCLALQRDACIQELVVQSNNVVRNAVSRVRTETEEIVQAGCARISNRLDSTAVALRECEQQFQANTKADAQEAAEAFRKQLNLLADEILRQTQQAVTSMLDDLRNRMQDAASTP